MLCGIALVSVITAAVAAWFVTSEDDDFAAELRALRAEVSALRETLLAAHRPEQQRALSEDSPQMLLKHEIKEADRIRRASAHRLAAGSLTEQDPQRGSSMTEPTATDKPWNKMKPDEKKAADPDRAKKDQRKGFIIIGVLVLLVGGCVAALGGEDEEPTSPSAAQQDDGGVEQDQGEPAPIDDPARVSRASLGEDWPLTVEEGVLGCHNDAAYIDADSRRWALNGMASMHGVGIDIDPIWADDPNIDGAKKNIGVLIRPALQLCED